jgi:hypothetical protein
MRLPHGRDEAPPRRPKTRPMKLFLGARGAFISAAPPAQGLGASVHPPWIRDRDIPRKGAAGSPGPPGAV